MQNPRILIIRVGVLGDTIFATALLDALSAHFKHPIIHWLGSPLAAQLLKEDKRVEKVFPLKKGSLPLRINKAKRVVRDFSKERPYDVVLNLETHKKFQDVERAVAAKEKRNLRDYTSDQTHAVHQSLAILRDLVSDDHIAQASPSLPAFGHKIRQTLPSRYICISPSIGHIRKKDHRLYRSWPASHWIELIGLLSTTVPVVILGDKQDDPLIEQLLPLPPSATNLAGKTSLQDLVEIIRQAKAVVTVDTGTAHVAAACNTPVYALFGPTYPECTGPYKTPANFVEIISANLECSPCSFTDRIRSCPSNQCMQKIEPDLVAQRIIAQQG